MNTLRLIAAFLGCSILIFAAGPVATVTSSGTFELQGHEVNVAGVPTWPVASGEVVATRSEPATIQLREGGRLTLLEGSKVRIDSSNKDGVNVYLLAGRLQVGSIPPRQANIYVDGKRITASSQSMLASRNPAPPRVPQERGVRSPAFPTPVSSK